VDANVIVVGGGPAGLAAAVTVAPHLSGAESVRYCLVNAGNWFGVIAARDAVVT
jgi:flavin-dependent dehydrogenase